VDILPELADLQMQGLGTFEVIMGSFGLTSRRPVADPVSFTEPDPLGAGFVHAAPVMDGDVASIISKPSSAAPLPSDSAGFHFRQQLEG
jgi:hypothetical protein